MFGKLKALFHNDPVVDLIQQWITQPVIYEGFTITRSRGLPQGAVISPLLANLYLDEFDDILQQENFKLIRYADDFVVLCKSKNQAKKALERVKEILKGLELEINPDKTQIASFDQGFQYLGYLFCQSMVVETDKKDKNKTTPPNNQQLDIPTGSWLSLVDGNKMKSLLPNRPDQQVKIDLPYEQQEIIAARVPVYVTDSRATIRIALNQLEIHLQDDVRKISLRDIAALVIFGKSKITMPAVIKLSRNNIPTFFCRRSGQAFFSTMDSVKYHTVWLKQLQLAQNPDFTCQLARQMVSAKINNYAVLVRRQKWQPDIFQRLHELENKASECRQIDSLRGYEGQAAKVYFQEMAKNIPEVWQFNKRLKYPSPDPVNAMLSFGYTILYHHLATALQITGLNPTIGWYHQPQNHFFALAADLQEEFRFLIDSVVLNMIHRNSVKPADFSRSPDIFEYCVMNTELLKKIIAKIESRLLTLFQPANQERKITYRDFLYHQANSIKHIALNPQLNYQPLRIR